MPPMPAVVSKQGSHCRDTKKDNKFFSSIFLLNSGDVLEWLEIQSTLSYSCSYFVQIILKINVVGISIQHCYFFICQIIKESRAGRVKIYKDMKVVKIK